LQAPALPSKLGRPHASASPLAHLPARPNADPSSFNFDVLLPRTAEFLREKALTPDKITRAAANFLIMLGEKREAFDTVERGDKQVMREVTQPLLMPLYKLNGKFNVAMQAHQQIHALSLPPSLSPSLPHSLSLTPSPPAAFPPLCTRRRASCSSSSSSL
jgi:hypothetical protein